MVDSRPKAPFFVNFLLAVVPMSGSEAASLRAALDAGAPIVQLFLGHLRKKRLQRFVRLAQKWECRSPAPRARVVLYLTYWFRRREQAQVIALFMAAVPVSYVGRSDFGLHPGPRSLASDQQLALAPNPGRTASGRLWRLHLFPPAEPPGGSSISHAGREGLDRDGNGARGTRESQ